MIIWWRWRRHGQQRTTDWTNETKNVTYVTTDAPALPLSSSSAGSSWPLRAPTWLEQHLLFFHYLRERVFFFLLFSFCFRRALLSHLCAFGGSSFLYVRRTWYRRPCCRGASSIIRHLLPYPQAHHSTAQSARASRQSWLEPARRPTFIQQLAVFSKRTNESKSARPRKIPEIPEGIQQFTKQLA